MTSLTWAIDTIAGGAVDTATSIMSGNLWTIIYVIIGISIIWLVVWVVRKFTGWGK